MLNEFRQDLVSGDWVLFSTERSKKPINHKKKKKFYQSKDDCPFENPQASGQGEPLLVYLKGQKINWADGFSGQWTTQVIKNKYPAVRHGNVCGSARSYGPIQVIDASGFHEVVITKDHDRSFAQFDNSETEEIVRVYLDRFREISKDSCNKYILIFHNHGSLAGASIYHNHSQILSMPILPPEVLRSVKGSEEYYLKNKQKVHDMMVGATLKDKKRVVFENEKFIAFCPYVSKTPYEVRIFPKQSSPRFENISDEDIPYLADSLNMMIKKLHRVLDNPDYNFYIHTAPVDDGNYDYYHWHVEIVPKVGVFGGFELGTDMYINDVDPDEAAEKLRNTEV
ncbi:MAG: galactose-1-phosphate uridylyltransferase [Patescibacteria group bacterium]